MFPKVHVNMLRVTRVTTNMVSLLLRTQAHP